MQVFTLRGSLIFQVRAVTILLVAFIATSCEQAIREKDDEISKAEIDDLLNHLENNNSFECSTFESFQPALYKHSKFHIECLKPNYVAETVKKIKPESQFRLKHRNPDLIYTCYFREKLSKGTRYGSQVGNYYSLDSNKIAHIIDLWIDAEIGYDAGEFIMEDHGAAWRDVHNAQVSSAFFSAITETIQDEYNNFCENHEKWNCDLICNY